MKKILFIFLALALLPISSNATTWFFYDNENGVVGSNTQDSSSGPYLWENDPPAIYRSDSIRGKYIENYYAPSGNYGGYNQSNNPNGIYGTSMPMTVVNGSTYYIGAFLRFNRINGLPIWKSDWDFNKQLEIYGSSSGTFRWIVLAGYGSAGVYNSSKFIFNVYASEAMTAVKAAASGWPYWVHNMNGYNYNAPYYCDYEKWYAVVMGITVNTSSSGRIRLWINGTNVMDISQRTREDAGTTVERLQTVGTVAQPDYGAPPHKHDMDGLVYTDDFAWLTANGYLANPEGGTPPPDTTPDQFNIHQSNVTFATRSTVYTALTQITGIDTGITCTGSGGTVAACTGATVGTCGTFGATSGTITNNQYVAARVTSSASYNTIVNNVVTCGGVSDTYSVQTGTAPDSTTPVVTFQTSSPQAISADSLSVAWTATDAVGVTLRKWRIGAAPNDTYGTTMTTSPTTTSGYSEGANQLYIGARDAAGNWGYPSPGFITVNRDSTPAFVDNLSPVPGTILACTSNPINVPMSFTTSEIATGRFGLTDAVYGSLGLGQFGATLVTSHTQSVSVPCGQSRTYYIRTSDALGNLNTSSATISFSVASPQVAGPGGLRIIGGRLTH